MKLLTLSDYIKTYFGDDHGIQATIAESLGTTRQQMQKWLSKGYFVGIDGERHFLLSEQRELGEVVEAYNDFEPNDEYPYPLFCMYDSQYRAQPAYLTLDVETGAVSADYNGNIGGGMSEDVWRNRVLHFPCDPLVSSDQIKSFIDEHLDEFQKVLAVFKITHDGDNYIGEYIDGFRASFIVEKLSDFVSENLINEDPGCIIFNDEGICETQFLPLKGGETVQSRVEDELADCTFIDGYSIEDACDFVIRQIAEKFMDDDELPFIETVELLKAVEAGFDLMAYHDDFMAFAEKIGAKK